MDKWYKFTVAQKGQHKSKSRNATHEPQRKLRRNGSEQRSGPGGRIDKDV